MFVLFVARCRLWFLVDSTFGASLWLSSSRLCTSYTLLWPGHCVVVSRNFVARPFSIDTGEGFSLLGFDVWFSKVTFGEAVLGVIHGLGVSIRSRLLPRTTLALGALVVACLTLPLGVETS